MRMPTLFISHGAPALVLTHTPASQFMRTLPAQVPKPRAILAVSAHWEEGQPTLGLSDETIHDFYGFPKPLYELTYRAPVARDVTARAMELLKPHGAVTDATRGRDHGTWAPLILAWPQADVPIAQLSLTAAAPPKVHYDIGRALAPLRDEGVLIIGSGSVTHNLRARPTPAPAEWATRFVSWLDETLETGNDEDLLDWRRTAPYAEINHPSTEHFDPIFVARGAAAGERSCTLHASYEYGSLSMNAYAFGGIEQTSSRRAQTG